MIDQLYELGGELPPRINENRRRLARQIARAEEGGAVTDWAEWSRQAVAEMQARNEAWISRFDLKRAPYRWDSVRPSCSSSELVDHVVADLCLVGTISEAEGTFLWAWDNDAIPATAKLGLDVVRSFRGHARSPTAHHAGVARRSSGRAGDAGHRWTDPRCEWRLSSTRTAGLLLFFTLHSFRPRARPETASGAAAQRQAPRR